MGLCSILTGLIIAFIYSWKLTLLIIAFLPLIMIGGALQMQMLAGAAGKNKEALEAAGKVGNCL
jgi:ABC-type bacteriocin/lantibiotic exporter with double-glycine peptidase domain